MGRCHPAIAVRERLGVEREDLDFTYFLFKDKYLSLQEREHDLKKNIPMLVKHNRLELRIFLSLSISTIDT